MPGVGTAEMEQKEEQEEVPRVKKGLEVSKFRKR